MAPAEDTVGPLISKKRGHDAASVSSSSSSDDSARNKKQKRKDRKNGKKKASGDTDGLGVAVNGSKPSAFEKRRNSLGKAARDPRDEPPTKKKVKVPGNGVVTRSPSPVIDYDGLSRPSMFCYTFPLTPRELTAQ